MSLFHTFPYHEVRHRERLSYLHFWTCHISVKREFMLRYGMFDERFLGYEDMICGHRLAAAGMRLRFLPSARGKHLHQMKPEGVPAKGIWYGRWLYLLAEHLPERDLQIRFGILSRNIGWKLLSKRLLCRAGFHIVNTPPVLAVLRLLGAESGRRTRISDLYYFLIFRGNMLAGYAAARREARAGRRPELRESASEWVARGE
jgi:GT2 family glycosyltransferase